MSQNTFFQELKRRNVFKVASIYAVTAWLIIQVAAVAFPAFELPIWTQRLVIILAIIGFPIALIVAWAQASVAQEMIETEEGESAGKNSRIRWITAFSIIALGLIGLILWQNRSPDSQKETLLPVEIRGEKVAVSIFDNLTDDENLETLGYLASEWISSGLRELDIRTVAPEMVRHHKDQIGILPNNPNGETSFAEITGAKYVITGSYFPSGDSLILNTRLNSTETGEVIRTFPQLIGHQAQKEQLVESARQYILGFWGLKKEQRIPDINPPKYDAYKAILECTSWQFECFYKALSIDPDFLLARIRLMGACTITSDDSLFYSNKAIIEKEFSRLTKYERAMFEMYSHAWEGDRTEKIKYIDQLYQVDTNNYIPLQWLGYNLLADNASIEAAEKFSKIFQKADLWGRQITGLSYSNFIEATIRIHEYKKASDFYLNLTNEQQTKAGAWALHYAIQALIYQNRIQEVQELIEEKGTKEAYLIAAYAYNYIFPEKKNPFFKDLRERIGEFEDLMGQNEWIVRHVFNWNSKAMVYYVLKDWKNAEKSLLQRTDLLNVQFDQPFDQLPGPNYWKKLWHISMLGTVYAHLGKVEACQAQIDQLDHLKKLYPKTNSFYHRGVVPYLKARIASIQGNKELAIELLNTSIKEGNLIIDWCFHFDQDFIPLKGYPPFEAILQSKDSG